MHERNVYLVLNFSTGCVSPQYHCRFGNFFEATRHNGPDVNGTISWQLLAGLNCAETILSELSAPTQHSVMYPKTQSEANVPLEEISVAPPFHGFATDNYSGSNPIFYEILPLTCKWDTPTNHNQQSLKKRINRESQFQQIDHWTRPNSCGGSNQREPTVLTDSPPPHASADTLFCQPHVRLRSSINPAATIVGGNWGESGVSATLGDISCPD